jgi:hypothetical protein
MLTNVSRARLVGAWFAAVVVIGALGVVVGAPLTISNGELFVLTCLLPPSVMLLVWRGAPPARFGEVLYAVNHSSKDAPS